LTHDIRIENDNGVQKKKTRQKRDPLNEQTKGLTSFSGIPDSSDLPRTNDEPKEQKVRELALQFLSQTGRYSEKELENVRVRKTPLISRKPRDDHRIVVTHIRAVYVSHSTIRK
jgi:hypothetical protein